MESLDVSCRVDERSMMMTGREDTKLSLYSNDKTRL